MIRSSSAVASTRDTREETDSPPVSHRSVPLKFWLGPFRLWTASFNLAIEQRQLDPFQNTTLAAPNLEQLPANLAGVYRPSEPLDPDTPQLTVSSAAIRYVESSFNRRFIDLALGYDAYLAKFSSKTRSTITRKVRKFEQMSGGKVDWRSYRTADEMVHFHSLARQVSARTYQERLFDAGLPDDPRFIDQMRSLADAGNVRAYILFHEDKPVSYLYLPIVNRRVIYGFLGFDPTYAAHSPGTVLQLQALQSLFKEEAFQVFDFTEGEGEHKRLFATHARFCGNVFYLRSTVKSRMIVRTHIAVRRVSAFIDRQLVRFKVKTALKHLLRGQRARS